MVSKVIDMTLNGPNVFSDNFIKITWPYVLIQSAALAVYQQRFVVPDTSAV